MARKDFAVRPQFAPLAILRCFFLLCVLALAIPYALRAQTPTGSIAGTVTDKSGAVIPNAKISLTQVSRGQVFTTTADEDGNYSFGALEPGDYVVQVEAPNFQAAKLQLRVAVGRVVTGDVTLQVGGVEQVVHVTGAEATEVDVNRNTVSGVISETQLESLPTDGRNFLDLASLEPGVQVVDAGSLEMTKTGFTAVSIAGGEGRTTRIQVDGIDITDEVVGASTQNFSVDGIGGFEISLFSLDPSTSLSNTGAVNLVTRSGSNDYHGSAYSYWRDHNFASRIAGHDAPFHRIQGGFRAGGPALKDKVFWFLNFEDTGQDTGTVLAPVAPFSANPAFNTEVVTPFREHLGTGRADWNISSRVHAFARYSHDDNQGTTGFGGNILSPVLNKNNTNASVTGVDLTYSKITHSFRYGHINFADYLDPTLPAGVPNIPLQIIFDDTGTTFGPNFLANQHSLQTNDQIRYDGTFAFRGHVLQYGMNFTRVAANLFGAVFSSAPEVDTFTLALAGPDPTNPLDYLPARDIIFGNGLGFFSNKPSQGFPFGGIFNNRLAWYVADSIRPARDVTLNAGLRWEVDPGQVNNDILRPAILDQVAPGQSGREPIDKDNFAPTLGIAWNVLGHDTTVVRAGTGIYYETNIFENVLFDRANFLPTSIAPQFPVVFPGNNFVIGSDGNPINGPNGQPFDYSTIQNQPLSATVNGFNVASQITFVEQALQQEAAAFEKANFPAGNPAFAPCGSPPTCPELPMTISIGSIFDRHFTQPYSIQTNVGIQHKFARNLMVSADFVRNRGAHIYLVQDINHLGAARNFSSPVALGAISATNSQFGCGTGTDATSINCAITNGATIVAYAANGLGACPGCAFRGTNPGFGAMNFIGTQGLSLYKGLLLKIDGGTDHFTRFIGHASWGVSYALSRFDATQFDQANALNNIAFNNDCPTCFFGPASGDRTHQLSAYSMLHLPWGFEWNTVTHIGSPFPVTLRLAEFTGGSPAEIFFTDINGDGKGTDVLPGTNLGAFGRTIRGVGGLNNAINKFNANFAGTFTPAALSLCNNCSATSSATAPFTAAQLASLGAVIPPIASASPDQVTTSWLWTTDFRLGKTFRIRDHFQIEPAVDVFNVFNRVNFDPPSSVLSGTLFPQFGTALPLCTDTPLPPGQTCLSGSVNSTPAKFRNNAYGLGTGSFSPGIPRALQFLLRVNF
ncbi:MAG TPA: carboxypeptidase regulatory-like domain-containing protein [Candidatus Acidoferrales bacterium]|nr:carboxypeptidase regulatory-like domain-containing protein [Candidatus Acidoferrales bacterium]